MIGIKSESKSKNKKNLEDSLDEKGKSKRRGVKKELEALSSLPFLLKVIVFLWVSAW